MICVDELGPITPRTYPPAPGWSRDGRRIKAPLEYSRGREKLWVYGGLRVCDGVTLTLTAPSRNTGGYLRFLTALEQANPRGEVYLIADNLASHKSGPIQSWLEPHPRIHQVFIRPAPVGSTCRKRGGACCAGRPWLARVSWTMLKLRPSCAGERRS